jgi:hypothetical protein
MQLPTTRARVQSLDDDLAAFTNAPAAKVFSTSKKSKFAQQREKEKQQRFQIDASGLNEPAQPAKVGLIGEIKERNGVNSNAIAPTPGLFPSAEGFPLAAQRHLEVSKESTMPEDAQDLPSLEGEDRFHQEVEADADSMMAAMSEQEILEAQQELKGMLPPHLLDFVMKQKSRPAQSGSLVL